MSKGSKQRPTNKEQFNKNYDLIFRSEKQLTRPITETDLEEAFDTQPYDRTETRTATNRN